MLKLIIAIDENYGFSYKGNIPWKCKEDLQNFKVLTDGKTVVMGRKTWESIPQKTFSANKKCIVVTRDENYTTEHDVKIIRDLKNIESSDHFLIGGKELVLQLKDSIDQVYLTVVKGTYEADIYFNELKEMLSNYVLISCTETNQCFYYLYSH